jgi:hypothetical protein
MQALNRACTTTTQLEMQTGIVVKQKQCVSKALKENFNSKKNKQIAKAVAKQLFFVTKKIAKQKQSAVLV